MSEAIRVLVVGAAGRMGRMVSAALREAPGVEPVAGVDRDLSAAAELGLPMFGKLSEAVAATCPAVAVDFTVAAAARGNLPKLVELGVAPVIGTTGLTEAEQAALDQQARERRVPAFLAANFAIGAVLMMRCAAEAARHFDFAEVIEYHHEQKLDAPSGTALRTVEAMLAARGGPFADTPVDEQEVLARSRGGSREFVHVHSVRMPGHVADQDVIFGGPSETLRISHRTLDRRCFMPGVVLAVRRVRGLPAGLTVGLERLLWPDGS